MTEIKKEKMDKLKEEFEKKFIRRSSIVPMGAIPIDIDWNDIWSWFKTHFLEAKRESRKEVMEKMRKEVDFIDSESGRLGWSSAKILLEVIKALNSKSGGKNA